jgi:glycosyltransferase involved in cell wall biosynthesis
MNKPAFSILSITKNSAAEITVSFNTLKKQTFQNWESIVQDCVSEDNTIQKVSDLEINNITIVSEQDNGIYDALNRAMSKAKGQIIGVLHSGDEYFDGNVLLSVFNEFSKKDLDVVYGNIVFIDPAAPSRVVRRWRSGKFSSRKLKYGWMPPHTATFIRREVIEKFGKYDSNFKVAGDYDYLLRILKDPNIKVGYVDQTLVKMRVGGASTVYNISNVSKILSEDLLAIRRNQIGGVMTLLFKKLRKILQVIFR